MSAHTHEFFYNVEKTDFYSSDTIHPSLGLKLGHFRQGGDMPTFEICGEKS